MIEDKQLINYKKSFFTKIKEKFLNFFNRNKNIKKIESIKEVDNEQTDEKVHTENNLIEAQGEIDNNKNMSKEEFMEIYNKVKTGEIDTETLEEEILYLFGEVFGE